MLKISILHIYSCWKETMHFLCITFLFPCVWKHFFSHDRRQCVLQSGFVYSVIYRVDAFQKQKKHHVINYINDLTAAFVHEWNSISSDVVRRYVRRMRSRTAWVRIRGAHNRCWLQCAQSAKTSHHFSKERILHLC